MNKKLLSILCVLILSISIPSYAATGYQGYAIYRDGVLGMINEWHTGIMMQPTLTDEYAQDVVGHVENATDASELTSWRDFLDSPNNGSQPNIIIGNFKGCYRPFYNMVDEQREAVLTAARDLIAARIEYTWGGQIAYDDYYQPVGRDTVNADDIISMRCDGFVEYVYEVNGIRIYGDNNYWNISKWGFEYIDEHNGISITPKKQAEDYMRFISDFGLD